MVTAVAAALPVAVALALAALPIVLVVVSLASKRPAGVARAFLAGWLIGVFLVGALVILLSDLLVLPSGNPTWLSYVKIALGLLLLVLAGQKWLSRPRAGQDPETQGFMAKAETMTAGRAFALALALASLNPKNLVLVVTGATVIADATPTPVQQLVALAVFALVGSIGIASPVVLRAALGTRSAEVLASTDRWMTRYSTVIVVVVLVVLGVLVIANGVGGL